MEKTAGKTKILVVAPYSGLQELILSLASQYAQYSFDIIEANLDEVIPKLRQVNLDDYDVILSRGGTTDLIAKITDKFVVNLGISGYDVLRLIMLARNYPGRAVIIGFESITHRCRLVCELLKVDMDIHTIENEAQVNAILNNLHDGGDIIVLGDVISTRVAASMGFTNLLITSGVESVQDAMAEIERQTRFLRQYEQQSELYRSLLAGAPHRVYVFDQNAAPLPEWGDNSELCTLLTRRAAKPGEAAGAPTVLRLEDGRQYYVTGKRLPGEGSHARHIAFYVREMAARSLGGAVTLLAGSDIAKSEFNLFAGKNEQLLQALELAHELAPTNTPVLIEGEVGAGKSLLAKMIHTESPCNDGFFVQLNCSLLGKGELALALDQDLAEVLDSGRATLFFNGVGRLPRSEQESLSRCLPSLERHRLVMSSEQNLFELARDGRFLGELLRLQSMSKLWLPPLRERSADIEACFYHLITQINLRFGKQIVGIEKSALELLAAYNWPGNYEQFIQVLSDAVRQERGSYIRKSVVASLLSVYNQAQWTRKRYSGKTLSELEQEIVVATLQQLNMNQSQAAKQLGISRTTLWRLLKQAPNSPLPGRPPRDDSDKI